MTIDAINPHPMRTCSDIYI